MTTHSTSNLAAGLTVGQIVEYQSSEQVGELLADATAGGKTVIPFGGRSSLVTGRPAEASFGLDMNPCSGIISYAPADLTLSVRAGTSWATVQTHLGEHGQTLPLDVPFPERTTIGGLVATGFAGARRYRQGSLRDLLIGCEYVRGDGLVAKAGGMVVKNVSGFEIPRFLHGSWGALAILTSVNLKVVPKPRADGTAIFQFPDIASAVGAGVELVRKGESLDAITVVQSDEGVSLAVRATGRPRAVEEMLSALSPSGTGGSQRLEGEESADWWQSTTDQFSESSDVLLVAVTTRIDELSTLAARVSNLAPTPHLLVMPGYGSLRIRVPLSTDSDSETILNQILQAAGSLESRCVVESAPVDLRSSTPVWGVPDTGLETMRSIKRSFDPASVLNPDRLFV